MPASNENSGDRLGASSLSGAVETLEELMGADALKRCVAADLLSRPQLVQQLLDELSYSVCWKDRDGRYVGANRTMLNNLGVASSEKIGSRRSEDFFPAEAARILDESDRYVMAHGSPSRNIEQEITSRNGTTRVVSTTKLPIFNEAGDVAGLVAYAHEITERQSAITALRTSEMRYSVAARASRDGIWDLDLVNGTLALSKRCRELLGLCSDRELVSWSDVAQKVGRDQARKVLAGMQAVRSDSSQMLRMKVKVEADDGAPRWLEIVGAQVEIDGVVTRIVGALTDVSENHLREQNLLFKATHDELTLLLNRAALTQELEKLLAGYTEFGLLSIDVDQFRFINDSLGHAAGDQVIQALGQTILEVVGDSGVVARSGGDEFAVIVCNSDQVEVVATRLVQALSLPMHIGDFEMFVSATIGVVNRSLDHFSPPDLLRDVDNALYRAKKNGRGSFCVFNPEMREQADYELQLHNRIRRAVRDMEFELHYQPLYDALDGSMVAVEALIRWRPSDSDELVSPAVFLPYLERSGMILSVGRWVIDEACQQLAEWRATDSRMNAVGISVNVSRAQFRDSGLASCVVQALDRNGLEASDLSLEITETVVARSIDELVDQLMAVRGLGVKVAVDDFGVGHSSLSVLYDLPVDVLKIDRSFIDRIQTDQEEPVTSAALDIAKSLGLETVAEGVETDEQAEWLRSSGCNVLQGYLLSRPLSRDRVIAQLDAVRR